MTAREAAAKLGCSAKTLNGHIESGALRYVNIGHGSKRQRKMITPADLDPSLISISQGCSMSVYRKSRSPFWHYDFWCRGHRFLGSTKCTTRREVEAVERAEREKAKRRLADLAAARTSLRLDDIADRYWIEVGQHHAGADNTERQLGYLIDFFGKLTEITGDDVAQLVAWRRGHRTRSGALIGPFTVNDTTEQLNRGRSRIRVPGRLHEGQSRSGRAWMKLIVTRSCAWRLSSMSEGWARCTIT